MSRGQRIVQEIRLIRAAFAQQGYRIHKQPRQAVWVVHLDSKSYRLTYQPAPISAWAIHPPDHDASRLLGMIGRSLNTQSTGSNGRGA